MTQTLPRYLLDTNIVLQIVRGHALVSDLESRFALFTGRNRLLISYVTLAEIRVLGEVGNWNESKWTTLERTLKSCQIAPIVGTDVLDNYVAVDVFSRFIGRDMGSKNDIWIAATSIAYEATLLTTDKDFDHLTQIGVDVQRLVVDP